MFVRTLTNGWGIYVLGPDGQQQRLMFSAEPIAYPEWSPDGTKVAFHEHQSDEIWSIDVMDDDGSNEHRLTDSRSRDADPVWSPDGLRIAFSRDGDLWVMNSDGSDQRLLLGDSTLYGLDWSPDGRRIVFVTERDGDGEIYTIGADGGDLRRLTESEGEDAWPVWSPDGTRIAFVSDRDGNLDVYTMDVDGGNLQRLTNGSANDTDPAWSPDGSLIAFSSNRLSGIPYDTEIFVMGADGSDPRQVTNTAGFEWGLDWRP